MQLPSKKLLDQVRDAIRVKHYSYRTEEAYKLSTVGVHWDLWGDDHALGDRIHVY